MTGPGADEEELMWPGPIYTNCRKCGQCTESYYDDLCRRCEREEYERQKAERDARPKK